MSTDFITKYLFEPNLLVPGLKPIGPVEIDWTNPLTRKLTGLVIGGNHGLVDLVSGEHPSGTAVITPNGFSLNGTSLQFSSGFFPKSDAEGMTVFARSTATSRTNRYIFGFGTATSFAGPHLGFHTAIGKTRLAVWGNGTLDILDGVTDSEVHDYTGIFNSSNSALFIDGTKNTAVLNHSSYPTTEQGYIGALPNGTSPWIGDVYIAAAWGRALSDADVERLRQDPYQILKPATAQIYNFPSVADTEDDLLADNLQSVSSVSTPDVGQDHAILADDLQSLSQLSTPTVTTGDNLLADDLQSTSEVGTVTIGQEHVALADDLQSLSQLSTPTVGQEHVLLADDLQSLSQLSTPTATEVIGTDILLADDLESISEVGTPTIGQEHVVLADDLESISSLSTPTVGQEHALLSDSLQSLSQLSTPAVVEDTVNELLADDLESVSEVGTATVAQIHALLSDSLQSVSELTTPTVVSVSVPLIDGATSQLINTNGGSLDLYFNGTDYFEVA